MRCYSNVHLHCATGRNADEARQGTDKFGKSVAKRNVARAVTSLLPGQNSRGSFGVPQIAASQNLE